MLETIDFITQTLLEQKGKLDRFDPPVVYESTRWQQWVTQPSPGTCPYCMLQDGRIYSRAEQPSIPPPVHPNCKCRLTPLREIPAGMATDQGLMGADFWLKMSRTLPEYYISEEEIRALGWRDGKAPVRYAPGKMIAGGYTRMMMAISRSAAAASGTRRISITTREGATGTGSSGRTMASFL